MVRCTRGNPGDMRGVALARDTWSGGCASSCVAVQVGVGIGVELLALGIEHRVEHRGWRSFR